MISREDQTWTNVVNNGGTGETQTTLFEIALSLGRIADMLAEMNDYIVEYGEQARAAETHDAVPVIRCKDCKFFELNHFDIVSNVPIITAHEICTRWGDEYKTGSDGYCFLAERKEK